MRHEPVDVGRRHAGVGETRLDRHRSPCRPHAGTLLCPPSARWPTVWWSKGRRRHRAWRDAARPSASCEVMTPGEASSPSLSCASSTIAPAPSPNSTQVVRSCQSRMRENVSAPITSARLCEPETQELVGRRHGEDEARAHRLQIECDAVDGCRDSAWTCVATAGKV